VFAQAPYAGRGTPDTPNASDSIFANGGDRMLVALTPSGDGYAGTFSIGVDVS
jgi:hypothetical protein